MSTRKAADQRTEYRKIGDHSSVTRDYGAVERSVSEFWCWDTSAIGAFFPHLSFSECVESLIETCQNH